MERLVELLGEEVNQTHGTTTLGLHCSMTEYYLVQNHPNLKNAGLFHVVYGTCWMPSYIKPTQLRRLSLADLIGKRPEELIFLWALASGGGRKKWISKFFFDQDREDLLALELANYKADCADKIAHWLSQKNLF